MQLIALHKLFIMNYTDINQKLLTVLTPWKAALEIKPRATLSTTAIYFLVEEKYEKKNLNNSPFWCLILRKLQTIMLITLSYNM